MKITTGVYRVSRELRLFSLYRQSRVFDHCMKGYMMLMRNSRWERRINNRFNLFMIDVCEHSIY
jgi:hypothetical protein